MSPEQSPRSTGDAERGGGLLASISREMVRSMKNNYGKGPVRAKSYLVDDMLFVVMRGGLIKAEETLIAADKADTVRAFRQEFQNEMETELVSTVERLTDRRVINYQSQILFEPTVIIEIFMFDQPLAEEAQRETVDALMDPERKKGEISGDDVETRAEAPTGVEPV